MCPSVSQQKKRYSFGDMDKIIPSLAVDIFIETRLWNSRLDNSSIEKLSDDEVCPNTGSSSTSAPNDFSFSEGAS